MIMCSNARIEKLRFFVRNHSDVMHINVKSVAQN